MLLDTIRNQLDSLSKSEHRVALAVLANPGLTIAENITTLARQAQVSEPTVVRFCRSLGYQGWHEFKLRLAQSLALSPQVSDATLLQDDVASDLVSKVCNRSINTLLDLRQAINPEAIERALHLLTHARKIEFYGQGGSGMLAADAQHQFFRSGVPTMAYADPQLYSISAALLQPGDVVVAISQQGNSTALLRSVQLAKTSGAEIIVLAPSGTPLMEMASAGVPIDLVFETDPYTPTSARLAYLVVIDILAVGLALRRGPELRHKILSAQKASDKTELQCDPFLQEAPH